MKQIRQRSNFLLNYFFIYIYIYLFISVWLLFFNHCCCTLVFLYSTKNNMKTKNIQIKNNN